MKLFHQFYLIQNQLFLFDLNYLFVDYHRHFRVSRLYVVVSLHNCGSFQYHSFMFLSLIIMSTWVLRCMSTSSSFTWRCPFLNFLRPSISRQSFYMSTIVACESQCFELLITWSRFLVNYFLFGLVICKLRVIKSDFTVLILFLIISVFVP